MPSGEIVGVIPAAGRAARIAPLPCSKEIYPVGFRRARDAPGVRPKTACHFLLERMRLANVTRAYVVLREGKWDIPAYLQGGALLDMHLAYLMMDEPFGAPFTLNRAYPFVRDAVVAFGFPDMLFQREDLFVQLLARQAGHPADLLLGLFPARNVRTVDMVEVDGNARVQRLVIKPPVTQLRHTWGVAVWRPAFTEFLREYVDARRETAGTHAETSMGDVIQSAVESGLGVEAIPVSDLPYLDIGTPDGLVEALRAAANELSDDLDERTA